MAGSTRAWASSFSAAAPLRRALILNGIIYGIAVACGFFLLVVPGLILVTIWLWSRPRSWSRTAVSARRSDAAAAGPRQRLERVLHHPAHTPDRHSRLARLREFVGAVIGDAGRVILGRSATSWSVRWLPRLEHPLL